MTRNLQTVIFTMLAFAMVLLLSRKPYVGLVAGAVVRIGTYLTWRPRGA